MKFGKDRVFDDSFMVCRMGRREVDRVDMRLVRLRQKPELVPRIAEIYMNEWAWHYRDDWGIFTHDEMLDDITTNYMDDIVVLLDDENDDEFIGTYAVLDADLKSHLHLGPWLSCLYVVPERRNRGHAKDMIERAKMDHPLLYLWCYTERERDLYIKKGFEMVELFLYDRRAAWILAAHHE